MELHILGNKGHLHGNIGAGMVRAVAALPHHNLIDSASMIHDFIHIKIQKTRLMNPVFVEIHQVETGNLR